MKIPQTPLPRKRPWKDDALACTRHTKFGAILQCAMNKRLDEVPHLVGKANVTSDGFVMCDMIDQHGEGHMGALIGHIADLQKNCAGLCEHLKLDANERIELALIIAQWIDHDYRKA